MKSGHLRFYPVASGKIKEDNTTTVDSDRTVEGLSLETYTRFR